jgi:hypothetical protein
MMKQLMNLFRKERPRSWDSPIDREMFIRGEIKKLGTNPTRIAKAHKLGSPVVNETIRGNKKGAHTRKIIADAIGMEYDALWHPIEGEE